MTASRELHLSDGIDAGLPGRSRLGADGIAGRAVVAMPKLCDAPGGCDGNC